MIRMGIFLDGKSVGKFLSPISLSSMKLRLFLYGRPVKWTQRSKGTDYAFEQYIKLLEHLRFNAK